MISRLIILIPAALLAAATLAPAMDLKEITYTTKDAGKVVFSHTSHLQKKTRTSSNFSCKVCHDSSKAKNVTYTMGDMEKGKSCGKCHNGTKAFALAKCTQCHKVRENHLQGQGNGTGCFQPHRPSQEHAVQLLP